MSSFIRHFRLHRTTRDSIVHCAIPDEYSGAITVLIGSNNAGKTYTLESLRHALDTTRANKAERIINLEYTSSEKPMFLYLGNNSQHMPKVGQGIDLFVKPEKIGHPRDIPNYRPAAQALLLDEMEEHAPGLRNAWAHAEADERRRLLDAFPAVNTHSTSAPTRPPRHRRTPGAPRRHVVLPARQRRQPSPLRIPPHL